MIDPRARPRPRQNAKRQRDNHRNQQPESESSSAEAGSLVRISVSTGWPVLSEWPRSPCASSFKYSTN